METIAHHEVVRSARVGSAVGIFSKIHYTPLRLRVRLIGVHSGTTLRRRMSNQYLLNRVGTKKHSKR
jgi:hypothetical protein